MQRSFYVSSFLVTITFLIFYHCTAGFSSFFYFFFLQFSSYHPLSPLVIISRVCARLRHFFLLFIFFTKFFPFLWLRHSSVDAGTSIRERRSCVPALLATGTPQYLIRSAFVWRGLRRCVWMCDKKMSDCSCVCVLLYAELSVYIDERSPAAQ